MPEPTTATPTAPADPKATDPTPTDPKAKQGEPAADEPLGDGGKKALESERAARKAAETERANLQKQLDAINQANESAVEKAQREANEAKEAATKATTDALRYRIAAETGITDNVDLILTASDEETMRKQAALWGERASTSPKPDLSQGGSGGNGQAANDPRSQFGQILQNL